MDSLGADDLSCLASLARPSLIHHGEKHVADWHGVNPGLLVASSKIVTIGELRGSSGDNGCCSGYLDLRWYILKVYEICEEASGYKLLGGH